MQVKTVADELLTVLKRDKIVLDWRKQQATRAAVRVAVEETLDRLPKPLPARSTRRSAMRLPARLRRLLGRRALRVRPRGVIGQPAAHALAWRLIAGRVPQCIELWSAGLSSIA
jgi:hypothetical protein